LEKLTNQLQLGISLAAIEWSDAAIAKKKKTDILAKRLAMTPMAVVKLADKGGGRDQVDQERHLCPSLRLLLGRHGQGKAQEA
jgi:hypothetical protein